MGFLMIATLFALPSLADDLHGHIELLAKGGKGPARGSDVRQTVIYFEPATPQAVRVPEKPFEMVTRHKELVPRVLVIPGGYPMV